ncbi:MAG: hypothetical protein QM774_09115 [Gordonia sp. (in: high G+C Gram-positive bacteria)]|uniref:hypothetical protein n=1 Tax=Gordonia sp. (in: high G+C Gram-positive bacteria) TaxID=84139 RepID=UPI0039E25858
MSDADDTTEDAAAPAAGGPVVKKTSPVRRAKKSPRSSRSAASSAGSSTPSSSRTSTPSSSRTSTRSSRSLSLSKGDREEESSSVPKRSGVSVSTRGLWFTAAAVVAVLAIAASTFFVIATARLHHERDLRAEYSSFAKTTIVKLMTLNPDNADSMYDFAMKETSGRAQQMFRDNMKQVADLVRKGDAKTETKVLAEAVSEAGDDEGTVLMVVGWVDKSASDTDPVLLTYRWKVDMTRINGALKLTNLEFVQ